MECEPRVDYGRKARPRGSTTGTGYGKAVGRAEGEDVELTLDHRPAHRLRGRARPRAHDPARRRHRVRRAVVERPRRPRDLRRGLPPARLHRRLLARVAQPRRVPRPPVAHLPAAQRADAQGAHLRADRRDGRGGDDVAARDARRRAQLGLPLRLDPRLDLHALGPLHARASTRRPTTSSTSSATSPSKSDDELQIMYGIGGEETLTEEMLLHLDGYEHAQPVRVGNGAYAQRQHDVWGALLDSIYLHTKSRDGLAESTWEILVQAGRPRDRRLARARPRHLGGARRAAALHLVEGHVLGRLRPRRAAGAPARGPRAQRALAARGRRRSTPTSARTASTSAACSASTTTPTALDASCLLIPLVRFLPPDDERVIATVNAIADELTLNGLVQRYQRRGDRRRPGRRGGHRSPSARSGWSARWPRSASTIARRALCEKMLGFASRLNLYAEEIDARSGPPPGQLPAGLHPPGAHQRRHARHPRRPRPRRARSRCSSRAARRSSLSE